ncbi:glycosyltransferase family 9 protein [Chromobacterium sp. CV08]|uniref:glycosyltransferase family 9 protein n=1 Tax=Chromobacterium sp. CV08 TaxID=3133274 RepID=UPI003DA7AD04
MKILIIKLSALGDVLASSPIFHLIKDEHPECQLHHLVMKQCSVATESNRHIDKQHIIELVPSGKILRDLKILTVLWWKMLWERYDTAIILHRNIRFQLLCKAAGIKRLIGFSRQEWNILDCSMEFTMKGNRTMQEVELLRKADLIHGNPTSLEFYIDTNKVDLAKLSVLPANYIAVNPCGGNPHAPADNKIWPTSNYITLINSLDLPVILLGNGDREKAIADLIEQNCNTPVINMVNRINFHEAAHIIQRARLYIGNDSALLYLAAALKTRSIGLYGPTAVSAFLPLGNKQFYIHSQTSCSPCYNSLDGVKSKMYSCADNVCMKSISPSQVLKKVQSILEIENQVCK